MVLGDSISAGYGMSIEQGWVSLMDQKLIDSSLPWKMTNASISGETTGGALARLPELIETIKPSIVIIELGGNDGLRGYPVPRMSNNIEQMIDIIKSTSSTPILMGMRIPPNYGARYTSSFEKAYHEIAKEKEVQLIPFLFDEFVTQEGLMQADGIHPSASAQPKLMDVVWQYLSQYLN